MAAVVVLLGPPGSGKSAVATALWEHGFRWRDWEAALVEEWASRDAFLRDKSVALPRLHEAILEWLAGDEVPAVLETTGLSDAPLLEEVRRRHGATVVRLDVSLEVALDRIRSRPGGAHLSDELEDNRRVWLAFDQHVRTREAVDLVVDAASSTPEAIAEQIAALVA